LLLPARAQAEILASVMTMLRLTAALALLVSILPEADAVPSAKSPNVPEQLAPEIRALLPGLTLTLVAEHPHVVTPTGLDVDAAGNVWAVSSHTHFRPEGYPGPEKDEIVMLSKPDASGRMTQRAVFYNHTAATMDLELGKDGWVYLAERGRILRVKDSNGDGVGDQEENLAVLKTIADYPHNGLAGLAWHPSGDLIFSLGENMWKEWTLVTVDGHELHGSGEGGIFRCRPDGRELRRIARGFWNPFGVCVRADGEIFAAENDPGSRPPCRLLHIVEGGDYGYQRTYGEGAVHPFVAWNGELRGTLPMVSPTGEAPCGIAPLGGGLLVPSWSDHRIDFFPLRRQGASYTSERVEIIAGSDFFRPVCLKQVSPTVYYLTDWVFGSYELHQRGRVWRLEIDPARAKDWLKPAKPEPPNDASHLAAALREGTGTFTQTERYAHARSADPFVARAALQALARTLVGSYRWPDDIGSLSEADRVSACLALKLATPQYTDWPRRFLADASAAVRFEALRWIADEQLTALKPEVEAMLKRSDLDYRLFEASLAAWNTVSGRSRSGINDAAMLLERLNDPAAPERVRAYSLRLLPSDHAKVTVRMLEALLGSRDALLTLEAVRSLAGKNSDDALGLLVRVATDAKRTPQLRAEAIVGLAADAESHRAALVGLATNANRAVRDEALRALRSATLLPTDRSRLEPLMKSHPESAPLVRAALDTASLGAGRPELSDLAGWKRRLAALTKAGDPEAGRRIFFHPRAALCSTCHLHSGRGTVLGPDLSTIAARNEGDWLLHAILQPNRDVAPQFFAWNLELKDGNEFVGIVLRKGGVSGKEFYRDTAGREQGFWKDDIVRRRELKSSLMPEGLLLSLTDGEIADLLAFLSARTTP
jgi:putative membrane-bound dehydrogenase-like protein